MKTKKLRKTEIIKRLANEVLYWKRMYNIQCETLIKNNIDQPYKVSESTLEEIIEKYSYEEIE